MSLQAGQVFAGYVIVRRLGAGGMGEVYLAQHPRLPRRDALKVLPPDLAADGTFRQRFLREADVVARLAHPNIVGVLDRGDENGRLWLSMPYIQGIDASARLAQSPRGLPLPEVAAIVRDTAAALDFAHARGVLHRDVKPANILLDGARAHLSDFGIARAAGGGTDLTSTGAFVGSLAYAAPEQLRGAQLGPRSDVYSLAATAFALLTGTPLLSADTPGALVTAALYSPLPRASARRAGLPPAVDVVLERALARDPAARTPSCTEFANDLAAALAGAAPRIAPRVAPPMQPQAMVATAPGGPPPGALPATLAVTRASAPPKGRRRAAFALAVVGALVIAGLGAWGVVALRGGDATPTDAAAPPPASAPTTTGPQATKVTSFTAVAPNGDPMPGFTVEETGKAVNECVRRNPSQFGPAPSSCFPTVLSAYLCWDSRASVLCLADAWGATLRRYGLSEAVQRSPYAAVDGVPTRLTLADGRRCGIRLNSDQGREPTHSSLQGYTAAFYCGRDGQMLWGPSDRNRRDEVIDKSTVTWKVKLSNGDVAPTTVDVAVAEFATT